MMTGGAGGQPLPPPYPGFPSPSSVSSSGVVVAGGGLSPNPHFRPSPHHVAAAMQAGLPPHVIANPAAVGPPPPPPPAYSDAEEKQRLRFQIELEFVQCLGNPNYLRT